MSGHPPLRGADPAAVRAVGERHIHLCHPDPAAAAELDVALRWLGTPEALTGEWREALPAAHQPWAETLWTQGPAHLGRYLTPPWPQPDLGWLSAFDPEGLPEGPVLILGGGVGGEALALPPALADRDITLLDSHPWLLAAAALATGDGASLPVTRRPSVLEVRALALPDAARQALGAVRLVLGDAHDPPFGGADFAAIVALNVVDSVRDPWTVMQQCEAMLKPGGALILSAPWHTRPEITPDDRRLDRGFGPDVDVPWGVAGRLTGAAIPGVLEGLALQHLERALPWRLQVHDRLAWDFEVDVLLLRRLAD